MKICFLAPANSAHTIKWCRYFVSRGNEVHVISLTEGDIQGAQVHLICTQASANGGDLRKLLYLTRARQVRKLVNALHPDILSVHYASSYGTLAALAGLRHEVLSVWGSDIFDFPNHSKLHRWMLQYSLAHAEHLFSTSQAMADEARKYTDKPFEITPFGVDTQLFSPEKRSRQDSDFCIGTVKGLSPAYGIDTLLQAAALVRQQQPELPLRVRIAGKGPLEQQYQALARELGVDSITTWLGFIPPEQAAAEWANLDAAIICSRHESFGVSAVEAQACGCPVIISDIPGLMEATAPGTTSLVVPVADAQAVADQIVELYQNSALRARLGSAGRGFVLEHYELNRCFQKIESLFQSYRTM